MYHVEETVVLGGEEGTKRRGCVEREGGKGWDRGRINRKEIITSGEK